MGLGGGNGDGTGPHLKGNFFREEVLFGVQNQLIGSRIPADFQNRTIGVQPPVREARCPTFRVLLERNGWIFMGRPSSSRYSNEPGVGLLGDQRNFHQIHLENLADLGGPCPLAGNKGVKSNGQPLQNARLHQAIGLFPLLNIQQPLP